MIKKRVAFCISGEPGSGSTTAGRKLAETLGLPLPYYSGGAARCLIQKCEELGQENVLSMYYGRLEKARLREIIVEMLRAGNIPPRPNITAEYASFPREFDFIIDEIQEELLEREKAAVHEGRMVSHLARKIEKEGRARDKAFIKIFCVADEEERILRLKNRPEYASKPAEDVRRETRERLAIERRAYKELYGVENHVDPSHFDVIIDTTHLSPDLVLREILLKAEEVHPGLLAQFLKEK